LRAKVSVLLLPILAILLSAILLLLAFPKYEIAWLAWIGLVPFLITICDKSPRAGFLLSYLFGIIFSAILFNWIFAAPGYQFYHHAILALIIGSYFAFFGLAFSFVSQRMGTTYGLIAAPFVWVCLEYIRSNLGFLALPFPILAHSQHQFLSIIQIASFAGAYGVSFLIVLVNAALALMLLSLVYRQGKKDLSQKQFISKFARNAVVGFAALLVILALLYGNAAIKKPLSGKRIKISILQGNIDQEKKSDQRKHAGFIMQRYAELTQKASQDQPDLIAWPEAATPGLVLKDTGLLGQMRSLIRKHKVPFIVGSSEYSKFSKAASDKGKVGNTALFFSSEGKVVGQYIKMRLIPFGEYIPLDGIIPWPRFIVPEGKRSYEFPGKEYTLFEIDGHKFGVVICSEGAFPDVFRKFVKKGAQFMFNLSNEGWFGETALYQKVAASVFRAVENRISIARAANTGISCFIDPYGRVIGRVRNNGRETLVEGYLTKEITVSEEKTFFTVYGDVFAYLSILITVVAVVLSFRKARK